MHICCRNRRSENSKNMKTSTQNKGKKLHRVAMLIVAGLISLNLHAQKSFNNYEFQKFTNNLFKSTDQIIMAFSKVAVEEKSFDEKIELEDWMSDLDEWVISLESGSGTKESLTNESETFKEEDLKFEDWMFNTDWLKEAENIAGDKEMELEEWMMNLKEWNTVYCENNTADR